MGRRGGIVVRALACASLLSSPALTACSDDGGQGPVTSPQATTEAGASTTGEPVTTGDLPTTTGELTTSTGDPPAACGDGNKDPGEACDDGNSDNTDYCLEGCVLAVCGDAFVQAGVEQCDDGNASDDDSCLVGCYAATCGDGILYAGVEECDDGNQKPGDGCDPDCKQETTLCGNGILEGDEACDDGNDDNDDDCVDCLDYACGDGWQHATLEQCDDANKDNGDDCVNIGGQCLLATCGDGLLHAGVELCDDGNADDTDECVAGCELASCGDGFTQAGVELCDDGENLGAYGGCNPGCDALGPRCGDKLVDPKFETCDDGNLLDGDGCSATCQQELPPECLGYVELKEADRASSFNDGPGKITKCDKNIDPAKWHRFTAPAGVVIPNVAPTQYSCGTDSPGYMLGTYPSVDDGIVPRTVCFPWFQELCSWSTDISVRNCGEYLVFQLPPPPACALRYCAGPQ